MIKRLLAPLVMCAVLLVHGSFVQDERDQALITGRLNEKLLQTNRNFAWFTSNYSNYTCNASAIAQLAKLGGDIHFIAFGGSWNEGTKTVIPQFYKAIDEAKINRGRVILYFLDRDFRSQQGFEASYGISNLPTLLVLKGNEEIGRISGIPSNPIEAELADVLIH